MLTDIGNSGVSVDFPQRKIPMEQLVSLGIQRALPGGFVLDTSFDGNYTSRLRTFLWVNGTASLAANLAAIANPQIWAQQVPNPYYGVAGMSGPGQCGTSTTVEAIELLTPLTQYCAPGGAGLVGEYNSPQGRNWYDALEVKLDRNITNGRGKGLSMQLAYTYSKTMNGDGYLNGWPHQDAFQIHYLAGTDRTHVLSVTSVYDLPVGRGEALFGAPPRVVSTLISDWRLGAVFNAQSGFPVGVNQGYSLSCPQSSYRPAGGTSVGAGRWFSGNASCWQGLPMWGLGYLAGETAVVRQPTIPDLDLSLEKSTPIHDNLLFTIRLDAFNSLNSVLFPGPNTNPGAGPATYAQGSGWSGFGTVPEIQQNFPRILQVGGNISF